MTIIIDVQKEIPMPMIDVTAVAGTFPYKRALTRDLTAALMRWEQVPAIGLFRDNTAAFVHDLDPDAMATANGDSTSVRVQILTPVGTLDRAKQLGVVKELTEIVAAATGDPGVAERTWVLITEPPEGGWGIGGHAYTRAEIAEAARRALSAG
jgi:phenylpyruvate tautomerase PptA (4-oxalocrotonate tautomerase family)